MGGLRVVFIGPDCGGKSSVAAKVGEMLGCKVYGHRRIADALAAVHKVITEPTVSREVNKDIIYDQWMFPVDIIYNRTLSPKPSPLEGIHDELASLYKKHGYVFVYVTASEEAIKERFEVRGDELWDLWQIHSVRGSYENYYEENLTKGYHNMFKIDTSEISIDAAAAKVVDYLTNPKEMV